MNSYLDFGDDDTDLAERMGIGPDPVPGSSKEDITFEEISLKKEKKMAKLYDLCVVTGKYVDKSGNDRNSYENVGMVMEDGKGGKYILLKRTFSPAGVPGDKSMVAVSLFKPKAD